MGWGARGPEAWLMLLMDISADDIPDENDVLAKGTIVMVEVCVVLQAFSRVMVC